MKNRIISIIAIIAALAIAGIVLQNNYLKTEISVLKSNRVVEAGKMIDSIKSAEFARYAAQLKAQDSIYSVQLILLQNENKHLKANYSRLYRNYSATTIDRPRW